MLESSDNSEEAPDAEDSVADKLFFYLYDLIYRPTVARLDITELPEEFGEFVMGLQSFGNMIRETRDFAKELAKGNLDCTPPPPANEMASPLKMLHSSLKHLTWQTQQVAKGDYNQRISFMGDFSLAFNNMIEQLEKRRKNILDEKTRLEMYVQSILVHCPNPILLFDSSDRLIYVSDSFFRYCKTSGRNEILGLNIHELFTPFVTKEALDEIENLYKNAATEEQIFKTEQEIIFDSAETPLHFELQITHMPDTEENSGVLIFLVDISENIRTRQDAERARDIAQESSRAKSNFLAKMSHEIRTPMNAILGMAELALRDNISQAAEDHIRIIRQAGINLLSIINDILDFSKIEAGKLEIVQSAYSFSSLAIDVINIIKTKIFESRLRFVAFIDSNIPNELFGDTIRIRQILLNLLSNAVKYTREGFVSFSIKGEIIEGEKTDDRSVILTITIIDSGKGIKQEEIGMLFGEFMRVDAEKNINIEGTGLGLAISRSLAAAMGGKIDVRSEYGKGSTFTVILPQKIRSGQKLASVENPEKKNVLIYERRDVYAESIVRTMENLGVKYRLVSSASEFFDCLESKEYSFVFLAPVLYDSIKMEYQKYKQDAKFAVVAEFGEMITDKNISIITMPVYSIPVANFLNGVSDRFTRDSKQETDVKFTAPEAKILVVDDINVNLEVAEGLLSPYKMQVDLCKSGMEAINKIKDIRYDLILLDIMMPEMDGIQTITHIRTLAGTDSYHENLPIVALTADAVSGTKEMLLEKSFDDFLSKPIDTIMLNTILEKWIPVQKQKYHKAESGQNTVREKYDINNDINIEGLDAKKGIKYIGGKREKYIELISMFNNEWDKKINAIQEYLKTDNIKSYIIYIHGLKSASASIGADELSRAAAELEAAGKNGDMEFIHKHNPEFIKNMQKFLKNIEVFLLDEKGMRST